MITYDIVTLFNLALGRINKSFELFRNIWDDIIQGGEKFPDKKWEILTSRLEADRNVCSYYRMVRYYVPPNNVLKFVILISHLVYTVPHKQLKSHIRHIYKGSRRRRVFDEYALWRAIILYYYFAGIFTSFESSSPETASPHSQQLRNLSAKFTTSSSIALLVEGPSSLARVLPPNTSRALFPV